MKARNILLTVLAAASALPCAASAQNLPYEDKAKYEHSLEQKADDVLVRLLGPNQAKVVVEANMDFSRSEKLEVSSEVKEDAAKAFKWQGAGGEAQQGDYLMPGFPAYASGGTESKSYNRQMSFPSAFVKKLTVSVIVNRDLPELDAEGVKRVVSEVLMLDVKRGDQLSVLKAPFAPLWRTIWYTPEAVSMVLKYVMLALMGIIGMIVVAVGFLKLAGAMSTMAKVQQSHQITMELGKGSGPGGMDEGPALPGGAADKPRLAAPEGSSEAEEEKNYFNVRQPQVPFLVSLMASEDPANVALVASHLAPDVKSEFLRKLPPPFASEVLVNMARIRFVEPEIIATLKDELERRLGGAVGGLDGALAAVSEVPLRARREMLAELQKKHPDLAAELRRRVLMPEDLVSFADKDISLLAGTLKAEEWATALFELPDGLRTRLKAQMAERTWQMIEQSMSYGAPSRDKVDETLERLMSAAAAMIRDGKIVYPASAAPAMIEGGAKA